MIRNSLSTNILQIYQYFRAKSGQTERKKDNKKQLKAMIAEKKYRAFSFLIILYSLNKEKISRILNNKEKKKT